MRPRPILLLLAVLVPASHAARAQPMLADGFEPGCPSSWSSASGWFCPDGDAPVAGNSLLEEPGDAGCPAGMARILDFCIDRHEASLAEILPAGLGQWSPYVSPTVEPVRALSVRGATPQAYVTQPTATAACANAGKRLCTDAEWLRACRGPSGWTYPWGNDAQPGRCHDFRAVHPLVEYYGTTEPWIYDHMDQPCANQLPDALERTRERPACVSFEGVFDLMGNLLEWTADPAGTLRGGHYLDSTINGPGCLYVTTAHSVDHLDFLGGFRCCADAN